MLFAPPTIVADAQIARLMQCGACDVAVTEDADLIAYVTRKRLLGLGACVARKRLLVSEVCVNGGAGMVVV